MRRLARSAERVALPVRLSYFGTEDRLQFDS
jgi:hypothetical protein